MLTLHYLEFEMETTTRLGLYEHSGTALRAALYATLSRHFCPAPAGMRASLDPTHQTYCPVCWLLAREEPESTRGKDVPRALTLRPPLGTRTDLRPGERWRFGLILFGSQAASLFPYLVVATARMGETGVGRPVDNGQRGRAVLRRVWAVNPLAELRQLLVPEGSNRVEPPTLAITATDVAAAGARLSAQAQAQGQRLRVNFLTPTRLVDREMLAHTPVFITLFERVLGRLRQLTTWYAEGEALELEIERLLPLADDVRLVTDQTQWVDLQSPSRQKQYASPIGGFVGQATYQSENWDQLLPWLLWGQMTQVGKNTVKGNGWYEVTVAGGGEGRHVDR